jgi:hypothetical protein
MTNRVAYAPQDFQKMCKQAERDHEEKKLIVLMDRLRKQIADRQAASSQMDSAKRPMSTTGTDPGSIHLFKRPVPSER